MSISLPAEASAAARRKSGFFQTELWLPASPERVFAFLADARNLDPVTPPWFSLTILPRELPEMEEGAAIDYRMALFGVPFPWRSRVVDWAPPRIFTYVQERGPYRYFEHEHQFEPAGEGTRVVLSLTYELTIPIFGGLLQKLVQKLMQENIESLLKGLEERVLAS